MKNYSLFLVLFITFFSCKNEEKKPVVEDVQTSTKSKFYKEVIVKNSGHFSGLILGEEFQKASKIIDENFKAEEDENEFILYKLDKTYTNSSYELYFKNNKLNEILFDTYVYDEKGMFDKNGSLVLFKEIKEDFLKRFGNKYMETSNTENEILFWSDENKDIQLIHEIGKAGVHVYIESVEITE